MLKGLHDLYSIIAVRVEASYSESVTSFLPSVEKFGRSLGAALTKQLLIHLNSCINRLAAVWARRSIICRRSSGVHARPDAVSYTHLTLPTN